LDYDKLFFILKLKRKRYIDENNILKFQLQHFMINAPNHLDLKTYRSCLNYVNLWQKQKN